MDLQAFDGPSIPRKKDKILLPLTPMIDIFSIIIIFLILGNYFGVANLIIPENLIFPLSSSPEIVETAPQASFDGKIVRIHFLNADVSYLDLVEGTGGLHGEIKKYVNGLSKEASGAGALLNFVADKDAAYERIYEVVKVFQLAGFDSILFVTAGE